MISRLCKSCKILLIFSNPVMDYFVMQISNSTMKNTYKQLGINNIFGVFVHQNWPFKIQHKYVLIISFSLDACRYLANICMICGSI